MVAGVIGQSGVIVHRVVEMELNGEIVNAMILPRHIMDLTVMELRMKLDIAIAIHVQVRGFFSLSYNKM